MSNLVDKEKLLGALSSSPHPELHAFIPRVLDGEFDFHPAAAGAPPKTDKGILQAATIRKACMGMATGKACVNAKTCKFLTGEEQLPCDKLLDTFRESRPIIKSGNEVVWDPDLETKDARFKPV